MQIWVDFFPLQNLNKQKFNHTISTDHNIFENAKTVGVCFNWKTLRA